MEHDSVIIDENRNCFWRNSRFVSGSKGHAGSVIDFAIEFNGAEDVKDAMKQIAQLYGIEGDKKPKVSFQNTKPVSCVTKDPKEYKSGHIVLPERDSNISRVYAYLLNTRKIERSVIRYFLGKDMLYQDTHKNCVFHTGTSFGCVRGTDKDKRFIRDLDGCDYNECFFFRGSENADTLVVSEAVIDTMSIMTQFYRERKLYKDFCYLSLSGVNKLGSVFYHINKEKDAGHPIKRVLIATDNDEAGNIAAQKIMDELNHSDVICERYSPPKGKDWNEYIVLCSADRAED